VRPVTTASGKVTSGMGLAVGDGDGVGIALGDGTRLGLGLAHPTNIVKTATAVRRRTVAMGFTAPS